MKCGTIKSHQIWGKMSRYVFRILINDIIYGYYVSPGNELVVGNMIGIMLLALFFTLKEV